MTKQEYIKRVAGHLQCSGARKKEILRQLSSDMEAALSEGRQEEDVLKEMGDPESLAGEFNDSLTEKERKRARRRKRLPLVFAAAVIILAAAGGYLYWLIPKQRDIGASGVFDAEQVRERSEEVVKVFGREDYDTLDGYLSAEVRAAFGQTPPGEVRRYIGEDWGEFRNIGNIYMVEIRERGKSYAVAQMNASFENVSVTFTFTFNAEMELYGFYVK